jgi:hypothetical protein
MEAPEAKDQHLRLVDAALARAMQGGGAAGFRGAMDDEQKGEVVVIGNRSRVAGEGKGRNGTEGKKLCRVR